jgi:DNA-binding NarL/FixJ family response regulator/tetratricopeptide (TPR) repeat protein
MSGRATELEQHVPFAVVIAALDPALATFARPALQRIDPVLLGELEEVFPALAVRAMRPAPPKLPVERYRLHHAIRALIAALAADRPIVLVLDDLHWADAASLELVAYLLRSPPPSAVQLILACRSNQASPELLVAIAAAARERSLTDLELVALTQPEAAELTSDLDARGRAALYHASGGNPFYLEQLASVHRRRHPGLAAPSEHGPEPVVPVSVRVVIEQEELARLSERARRVLQAAAVVGDPFDPAIAAAVAEVSEREALVALDEAAALELVRATDVPPRLRFRHPIVRRAVYESGGTASLIAAHARAARALVERDVPAMWVAPHVQRYARTGDEQAIELLSAAAAEAAPRAPLVAARWFQAALELLPGGGDPQRRVALLTPLAASLTAAGRTQESRRVLGDLLELLPEGQPEVRARVMMMVARADQMLGRQGRARQLIENELSVSQDSASRCILRLATCVDHWYSREPELVRASATQALDSALEAGRPELAAEAVAQVALGACECGATDEARIWLDAAQRLVDGRSDEQLAGRLDGLGVLGHANRALDRYDRAAALFERGLQIARDTGRDGFIVPLTVGLATVDVNLGRLDEALAGSRVAIEAAQLLRDPRLCVWSELVACRATLAAGDLREALAAGANAVDYAQDSWNTLLTTGAHLALAAAELESGEPAAARRRILDQAGGPELSLAECVLRAQWYRGLVECELALGDREAAEGWARRAEASAASLDLASATAYAERARAMMLLADDEPEAAAAKALRAAGRLRSIGSVTQAARADVLAGRALGRAGRRDGAIERLQHAHATLGACGAKRYRDDAARELRALGGRASGRRARPGEPAAGVAALTSREREVAELVASGLTNRQIAQRFVLSEKTVETHLSRILAKLGVASRLAVAGFLPPVL